MAQISIEVDANTINGGRKSLFKNQYFIMLARTNKDRRQHAVKPAMTHTPKTTHNASKAIGEPVHRREARVMVGLPVYGDTEEKDTISVS